mmetsp:Transcript_10618/g.44026  ORF Transcript_10618/g.44026 Transcript_10618/m.44026 type:complete len:310 (-) Transcript_10618:1887-2816(-)
MEPRRGDPPRRDGRRPTGLHEQGLLRPRGGAARDERGREGRRGGCFVELARRRRLRGVVDTGGRRRRAPAAGVEQGGPRAALGRGGEPGVPPGVRRMVFRRGYVGGRGRVPVDLGRRVLRAAARVAAAGSARRGGVGEGKRRVLRAQRTAQGRFRSSSRRRGRSSARFGVVAGQLGALRDDDGRLRARRPGMDARKHAMVPQARDAVSARVVRRVRTGAAGEMGRRRRRRPASVHRRRDGGGARVRVGRLRLGSRHRRGGRRLPRARHPSGPHAHPAAHVRGDCGFLRARIRTRVGSRRTRRGSGGFRV